jgi:hypothetical protein
MRFLEFQLEAAAQPLTDRWQHLPVVPRGSTQLGISFRPLQAAAFGLDARATLSELLAYPFQLIRLGAYWDQIEAQPGAFQTEELDWQIEAAEQAGKQIILCVGAVKSFGYPEFFVPAHYRNGSFPEGTLIKPSTYPSLLEAATTFISRLVERYKGCQSILAWQLEHEAVDPLGLEHSWRLDRAFVEQEVAMLKRTDPARPVLMNGFLPTSLIVRLSQWWKTRDQGDSLAVAQQLADWVGIDDYPRHALVQIGRKTLYLDGSQSHWQRQQRQQLLEWANACGKQLLITEGQAEPWETVTIAPNPATQAMYSCLPEQIIANYNRWMEVACRLDSLFAYLFWGAEYWMLRKQGGDTSYLQALVKVLS